MSKYKKQQQTSTETIDDSMKIAKAIHKPKQTKEQTKLIAQGIQKGIAEYKKQQKAKARELDKLKKQLEHQKKTQHAQEQSNASTEVEGNKNNHCPSQWLPWGLLVVSWFGFALSLIL